MGNVVVSRARFLDFEDLRDIEISDGRIMRITDAGQGVGTERIDANGGLVTPSFVDAHFHPDKALTFPQVSGMPSTTLQDSMARGAAIKAAFTIEDIEARATAALEAAVANGVGAMRAQVDVDSAVGLKGIEAMLRVKAAFADRITLQLVAFPQEGIVRDPGAVSLLRRALELGADLLGGGPDNEGDPRHYRQHVDTLFDLASEFDVDVDIHADMTEVPDQRALQVIAERTIAHGRQDRVNAVHCCALAAYPDQYAQHVIELVREAGMQICICPIGNLQLVGEGITPRGRGASRPKELLAAGVNVAAGTDNLHDMWFRFGNADPIDTALITCLAAGLRTNEEVREGFAMVTTRAANYLGLPGYGLHAGAVADLVIFTASTLEDILRDAPGSRLTMKRGRLIAKRNLSTSVEAP